MSFIKLLHISVLLFVGFTSLIVARQPHKPKQEGEGLYGSKNYEQLKVIHENLVKTDKNTALIACLERMVKLCSNIDELSGLLVELADAYYRGGFFTKAKVFYERFASLYPGNEQAQYALYRAILAGYQTSLSADRDQTITHEVIELCDRFLRRIVFKTYREKVQKIRLTCYQKLVDAEANICSYYVTRNNTLAINRRLNFMRDTLLPKEPLLEPQILAYEVDFAHALSDEPRAKIKQMELETRFPEQSVIIAHNKTPTWTEYLKVWA